MIKYYFLITETIEKVIACERIAGYYYYIHVHSYKSDTTLN